MKQKLSWTNIPQIDIQQVNQTISDDYDKLNAKNAVKAIRDLGLPELLAISKQEYKTKRRKTVLHAVYRELLRCPEISELYDDYNLLNAKDAIKTVRGLELTELLFFLIHEFNTKRRSTVLYAIRTKLLKSPEALTLNEKYQRDIQEGFTILQVGQSGVGKSATINSLFGKKVTETNKFRPQTKSVKPFEGSYHNVKYTIYDTPGLGEWNIGDLHLDDKYLSLMKEQCPLPDVLWYVLKLSDHRITEADANVLQLIRKYFGDEIWDRTMIVFTHSDMLKMPEEFQESFNVRTQTVNEVIAEITDGKVQGVPAVAVSNGYEQTPDGKSWLGELFTTSFERLNPEHQNAFFFAFVDDLKLHETHSLVSELQLPITISCEESTEKVEPLEKRIELTREQVERVKEKNSDVYNILTKVLLGAEIGGLLIDGTTGGATMGAGFIIGALVGGIAGLYEWYRDE